MTRCFPLGAAVLAALALAATPGARAADDAFEFVSVDEVARMLGAADVRILDANGRETYEQNRLPGAVFVEKPVAKVLPKDQTTRLVFYCRNPK